MQESLFDKEDWLDGSIAEKSRRSGADFLVKKSSQSRRPNNQNHNVFVFCNYVILEKSFETCHIPGNHIPKAKPDTLKLIIDI